MNISRRKLPAFLVQISVEIFNDLNNFHKPAQPSRMPTLTNSPFLLPFSHTLSFFSHSHTAKYKGKGRAKREERREGGGCFALRFAPFNSPNGAREEVSLSLFPSSWMSLSLSGSLPPPSAHLSYFFKFS